MVLDPESRAPRPPRAVAIVAGLRADLRALRVNLLQRIFERVSA